MTAARPPAVAGTFYPGSPGRLAAQVEDLLAAPRQALAGDPRPAPKAIVAPHAGYIYSGSTAALAYARVEAGRDAVRRVVLLGPCHRVAVPGLALPGWDAFETPLGSIPVDTAAAAALAHLPQVTTSPQAHAQEHSLEVHLPFLQTVLEEFTLVPLAVGHASPAEVAEVIDTLWGGPETLVVASSDLSHYLPYATARAVDDATIAQLLAGSAPVSHDQACGATPVNGLLLAARRRGLAPELLGACNSGDTAGDRGRVVGYASFAIPAAADETVAPTEAAGATETTDARVDGTDGRDRGPLLLALARNAIAARLDPELASPQDDRRLDAAHPWLAEDGAAFVTLHVPGPDGRPRLRGCIGTIEPYRSLREDVQANARAAAFRDPRFPPLTRPEYAALAIEVSVLSPREPIRYTDRADLVAQLRPGVDGLVLEYGGRRGTYLPQVWEQIADPSDFLASLVVKAHLPAGFWSNDIAIVRYTVTAYPASEPGDPPDPASERSPS